MSVATIMYTSPAYWYDFKYLAERMKAKIWETPEAKSRLTMRTIKIALRFLREVQKDEYQRYFPIVERPQPYELALKAFKCLGKPPFQEFSDIAVHKETLDKYLKDIQSIEKHITEGIEHNVPDEALMEMAKFFETVSQLDREIANSNRSRQRHQHGCF